MPHKIASDFSAERCLAISPEIAGWPHLTFRTYQFASARPIDGESVDDEVCMLFLAGSATVQVDGHSWPIDRDAEVFARPPQCLYLPPRHTYLLTPRTACEVAYARWPARGLFAPRFIAPETLVVEERGSGATAHRVTHILRAGEAEHLVCAEVVVPPGHWCPESPLKQCLDDLARDDAPGIVSYYRLAPTSGWAIQSLYDDEAPDEALVIGHGDAVMVRHRRHPVVTAPGARLYSLHIGAVADGDVGARNNQANKGGGVS